MEYKRMLLDDVLFAATTEDLNIPADNVKYLDIGMDAVNTTTNQCDPTELSDTLDEIHVKLGGEQIITIHFADLFALNTVWQDILPHTLEAGATTSDLNCKIEGVRLPLHVSKFGKSLSTVFTYLDNPASDTEILDASYQYREKAFANHFNIQYKEHTATTAATDYEVSLDYAGCELIGLLLNSCIIQTASLRNSTIGSIKLLVDDREVYHENWETMTRLHMCTDTIDDANWGAFFDNYRWLDFQQEPLPAGKLRALYQTVGDTAHLARFVPVYIQRNQST